jgi:hypothetical protein
MAFDGFLGALALSDVSRNRGDADDFPFGILDRGDGERDIDGLAVQNVKLNGKSYAAE